MAFGDKKSALMNDSSVTIITAGCHFDGKLFCRGASRIGGRIDGEIVSEGLLIIEESAVISADAKVEEAVIQGHMVGKLEATGRVELAPDCLFEGDIVSPKLLIHEGATFNGRAIMPTKEVKEDLINVKDLKSAQAAKKAPEVTVSH